jgi:hypothetical protein
MNATCDRGSVTSGAVAAAVGTDERMTRERLEQQTVARVLVVDDETASPADRRFSLPAGHDTALADSDNVDFMTPFAQLFVGLASPLDAFVARVTEPVVACPMPTTARTRCTVRAAPTATSACRHSARNGGQRSRTSMSVFDRPVRRSLMSDAVWDGRPLVLLARTRR